MAPIRPVLLEVGLSEQQWRVLRVLNDLGKADATGLATAAMLHAPSLTRILRELEQRALLRRGPDAADGRRHVITLTDAGSQLIATISERTLRILDGFARSFGRDRLDGLITELQAFSRAIGASRDPASAPGHLDR